jgi:hypothetical protein
MVELEWPASMRLGDSDIIRLALIPTAAGYQVQAEFPEHRVVTGTLQVARPGGYDLYASARLDGPAFNISPPEAQPQFVPPGEAVSWRWSLSPRQVGKQRLSIGINLRWTSSAGSTAQTPPRELTAYAKGLEVEVRSVVGLTQPQAVGAGVFGLFFGGSLLLFAVAAGPLFGRAFPHKGGLRIEAPNPALQIETRSGISLSPPERDLLQALFSRYARLAIESEFLSGYSGARTFLCLPVRADGRADAYTIAKLGGRADIEAEYHNYETFVKDTLPPITARIQHPPVSLPERGGRPSAPRDGTRQTRLAAVQYTFIGEPGSGPLSLRQALLANPDPALLRKLFETFGPNWWLQRTPYTFRLGQEYDRLLPAHLIVERAARMPGEKPTPLDARTPPGESRLQVGDLVELRGRWSVALRLEGRSYSLTGQTAAGHPPMRIRWLDPTPPPSNGPALARVTATRLSSLRQAMAGFTRPELSDPLLHLNERLETTLSGSRSILHGDLNLENVLVGPGGMVWLIDFARTREGHPLFDFAHLEAEIIAHVVAPRLDNPLIFIDLLQRAWGELPAPLPAAPGETVDTVAVQVALLHPLLATLHDLAAHCLTNPARPDEYLLAVQMACLGALKFENLNEHQRNFLYLCAAYLEMTLAAAN